MIKPNKKISNERNIEVDIRILPFNSLFIKMGRKNIGQDNVEEAEHYVYKEPQTTGHNLIMISKESKKYGARETTL